MQISSDHVKRVVVVHWKNNHENPFEVFSNLKNFCLSYKKYNYNTLSNYLSKGKIPYDNMEVRIERKSVILRPKQNNEGLARIISPVVRKVLLKDSGDAFRDLEYWLSRPAIDRVAAVTHIISQSLQRDQRIDKTNIIKRRLKV